MGRDYLAPEFINSLGKGRHITTLAITLGDGSHLYFATKYIADIGGNSYLAKLAPLDELNLELTRAVEGLELKIRNKTLVLGQELMNTPNVLNKVEAVLGVCQKVQATGYEGHDVKLPGVLEVGEMDDQWIQIFFKSKSSAAKANGQTWGEICPDAQMPVAPPAPPLPTYDDLSNYPTVPLVDERIYSYDLEPIYGRRSLPDMDFRLDTL